MSDLLAAREELKRFITRSRAVLIPATVGIVTFLVIGGANRSGVCLSEMRYLSETDFNQRFDEMKERHKEYYNKFSNSNKNRSHILYPEECCIIIWPNQSPFTDIRFGADSWTYLYHRENMNSRWWGSFSHYRAYSPNNNENAKEKSRHLIKFFRIDNCGNANYNFPNMFTTMFRIEKNIIIYNWRK